MKRVQFIDGSFLTADAIADGLLDLVATLGQRGAAGVVHVPSVNDSGQVITQDLVVGPASQIRAEPELSQFPEPDAAATLTTFHELGRATGVEIAHPEPASVVAGSTENWPDEL